MRSVRSGLSEYTAQRLAELRARRAEADLSDGTYMPTSVAAKCKYESTSTPNSCTTSPARVPAHDATRESSCDVNIAPVPDIDIARVPEYNNSRIPAREPVEQHEQPAYGGTRMPYGLLAGRIAQEISSNGAEPLVSRSSFGNYPSNGTANLPGLGFTNEGAMAVQDDSSSTSVHSSVAVISLVNSDSIYNNCKTNEVSLSINKKFYNIALS